MKQKVEIRQLGRMDFQSAWDMQFDLLQKLVEQKKANRKLPPEERTPPVHYLLLCEHPPVYTLGKSGKDKHLLYDQDQLVEKGATFLKINRGGDITFHGPGQLVVYPIFDLEYFFTDIHRYVRLLEEVIIQTLSQFNLSGFREVGYTGVWLGDHTRQENLRKICAIGVHLSRWITMHGLAFNVNTDLTFFDGIVPCGIVEEHKSVTSLEKELGQKPDMSIVRDMVVSRFVELFDFEPVTSEFSTSDPYRNKKALRTL